MKRVRAIETIVEELTDELVVCNLGFPSRELYALHDRETHFYMLGSMGLASSIGLGISLSQPRKVVVLDAPENYLLVVLDNRCYGSTGCQPTATAKAADLAAIASGAGVRGVKTASTVGGIRFHVHGSGVLIITVDPGNADVPIVDCEPVEIRSRFVREIKRRLRRR